MRNVTAHEFIPGRTLHKKEIQSSQFFDELRQLLVEIHRRDMAYVDLHKGENILIGDDGRPYLFDFQASFILPRGPIRFLGPFRTLLKALQESDFYHLQKHINHFAPANYPGRARSEEMRPRWIRIHRRICEPLRNFRRWVWVKLRIRAPGGRVETEHFVEEGLRSCRM